MKLFFALSILVFTLTPTAFAQGPGCRNLFLPQDAGIAQAAPEVRQNLNKYEQIFTRTRGLGGYQLALGPLFKATLTRVQDTGGHWLDAGAGDAVAVTEFLKSKKSERARASVISLESQAKPSQQLQVHVGRFIEEIPSDEISKSDVITDVFGPLAYSGHPHLILRKYFESLKKNGEIFVFLGVRDEIYGKSNRVVTADGQYLSLVEWLQHLPGVRTELFVERKDDDGTSIDKWSLRITRDFSSELKIPDVELIDFEPGAPPRMVFTETDSKFSTLDQKALEIKNKVLKNIDSALEKISFTQFMDSFRDGEISHPLASSIKRLKPNETWVNISEFGQNIQEDLKKKTYDSSNTHIFWGLSQKWIRFCINRINPQKFLYSNLKSSETIDRVKRVGLITDFYGDFVSSVEPDKTLQKYLDSMTENGVLYIYLGKEYTGFGASSEVLTKSGQRLNIRGWLMSIDGIKVDLYRGGYAYTGGEWTFVKIVKTKRTAPQVPRLKFRGSEPVNELEMPRMIFQEVTQH
jgi:hypothetical protein